MSHCEEDNNVHEWVWDKDHATSSTLLSDHDLEVKFHCGFSHGTAAIRGNKSLEKGRHHYWEVKMVESIYGTDVMVGVGTSNVDLHSIEGKYCSLLGIDQESYGFSYRGYIQHGGEQRKYGNCFGTGNLVGVHLDTWSGTLQFFVNRKPLGIAFTGLRDIILYPMISSTAAESKMRLIRSCSVPASLQLECLMSLRPAQKSYLSTTFPGLRYLSESIFADILQKHSDDSDDESDNLESLADCMILDDFDFVLVGLSRKKRWKNTKNISRAPVTDVNSRCTQRDHKMRPDDFANTMTLALDERCDKNK